MKAKPGYKLVKWFFRKHIEIPEDWELRSMSEICTVRQGLQIPISERFTESGKNRLQYITVKSIHSNNFKEFIEGAGIRVICNEDDILFTRTGNTGEIITNIKGVFHNNFFLINYDRDQVLKMHLVYFLKQKKIQSIIKSLSGSTTIPDLNHGDFYRLLIPLPPILKQQKIISILTNVDNLVSSYDNAIQTTKKLKTGLMERLLSRGIGHKKFKKIKWYFGNEIEIPEEWKVVLLKDLLLKQNSGLHDRLERTINGDNIVGMVDLYTHDLIDGEKFLLANFPNEIKGKKINKEKYALKENDFLYIEISLVKNGIGKTILVSKNGEGTYFAGNLRRFNVKNSLNSKFLFFYLNLNNSRHYMINHSYTSAQTGITMDDYFKIKILIPKEEKEQEKITSILNAVDSKIYELKSKKSTLESLKKGLMQKLLTGQIRVKV